ncbi:hypothetical protein TWF281_004827 [Arthrobotrys megalospora]
MSIPASLKSTKSWEPLTRHRPANLYDTVRPKTYLNALILNGAINDILHTIHMCMEERKADKEKGKKRKRLDLNFTLCRDDPYKLARDMVILNAMRVELTDAPKDVYWDIFFNHLISRPAVKLLYFNIHVLSRATESFEKWNAYPLAQFVHVGSKATLQELNRVFKRYQGFIDDETRHKRATDTYHQWHLAKRKVGKGGLDVFQQTSWSTNEPQARLERAAQQLHQDYWNTGRIGNSIQDPNLNLLFVLSPLGESKTCDFALNPVAGFAKMKEMHDEYAKKTGPALRPGAPNPDHHKKELLELRDGCMDEFYAWGSSLREGMRRKLFHINLIFSGPMEYLHQIRLNKPPNISLATAYIVREMYSENTEDYDTLPHMNLTYSIIDARFVHKYLGLWNLLLAAMPVLQNPSGLLLTTVEGGGYEREGYATASLFGVDDDTIWTLFGFRPMPTGGSQGPDPGLAGYLKGTSSRFWQNGRYGYYDREFCEMDLGVSDARLDLEFDEIVGVLSNICKRMFNETYPYFWKHTAATFGSLIYALKAQCVDTLDWSLVAREVRQAIGGEISRSDEFWVHQHIHGIAPEKVWHCHDEEMDIEMDRRLVCLTLFVPNTKFEAKVKEITELRHKERKYNLDPIFEVILHHPWKSRGCSGHLYRNLRIAHGVLVDVDGWKNYPEAEDRLHVYTGAPMIKCVRDGWMLPTRGCTAISFFSGLGLREWGFRAVNYTVNLVNGYWPGGGKVTLQSGVLWDDYEKDVMCFSRNYPLLIEDRGVKSNKRNRRKKKKKKAGGGGEDAKQNETKMSDDVEAGASHEESAKPDQVKGCDDGEAEVGVMAGATVMNMARTIILGGCPDIDSVFLKTKQGFDLGLHQEEESSESEDDEGKYPMGLDGTDDPPGRTSSISPKRSKRTPWSPLRKKERSRSYTELWDEYYGLPTSYKPFPLDAGNKWASIIADKEATEITMPEPTSINDIPEIPEVKQPDWKCGWSWADDWEQEQEAKAKGKVRDIAYKIFRPWKHLPVPDWYTPPVMGSEAGDPDDTKDVDVGPDEEVQQQEANVGPVSGAAALPEEEVLADGKQGNDVQQDDSLDGPVSGLPTPFSGAATPVEEEVLEKEVLEEQTSGKQTLEENTLEAKVSEKEVLENKISEDKASEQKVLDEQTPQEEALNEEVANEEVLQEEESDDDEPRMIGPRQWWDRRPKKSAPKHWWSDDPLPGDPRPDKKEAEDDEALGKEAPAKATEDTPLAKKKDPEDTDEDELARTDASPPLGPKNKDKGKNKLASKKKKRKRKGKSKGNATTADENDDESWYKGPQKAVTPEKSPEPLLQLETIVEESSEEGSELEINPEEEISEQKRLLMVPLIPRTKISFDKTCRHIISRKAIITMAELLVYGLDTSYNVSDINKEPDVGKLVMEVGIPGLYYFKLPTMINPGVVSVPCAKGATASSAKWVEESGLEIEFLTPGFVLGVKVEQAAVTS